MTDENCCEHGDHPAPVGHRFCSMACAQCENTSSGPTGCDGICFRLRTLELEQADANKLLTELSTRARFFAGVVEGVDLKDRAETLTVRVMSADTVRCILLSSDGQAQVQTVTGGYAEGKLVGQGLRGLFSNKRPKPRLRIVKDPER